MFINGEGSQLCESCFAHIEKEPCEKCGYTSGQTADRVVLAPGTVLDKRYRIGKSLGKGGFGITYLAYDMKLDSTVAIKEYYPYGLATRDIGTTKVIAASSESKMTFEAGANKFYEEAKLVAKFNGHPNIVSVTDYFRDNDTVYFVMVYLEGMTLKAYLHENKSLTAGQALYIANEVSNALVSAHDAKILHRDISPDNIMVCNNGTIRLLDFGAARQILIEGSQSLSVILKQGFAPLEQYQKKGKQGPWTDIYSLGATLYYSLTGDVLDDPMTRLSDDDEYSGSNHGIDERLWQVIKKATMLKINDRYQDIFQFRNALEQTGIVPEPIMKKSRPPVVYEKSEQAKDDADDVTELIRTNAEKIAITASAKEVAEIGVTAPAKEVAENSLTVSLSEIEETPVTMAMDRGEPKKKSKTGVIIGAVAAIAVVIGAAVLVPGMLDDSGKIKVSEDTSVSSSTPEVTGTSPKETTTTKATAKSTTTTTTKATTKAKTSKTTTTPKVTTTTTPKVTTTTTPKVTTTTTPKATTTTPKATTTTTTKATTTKAAVSEAKKDTVTIGGKTFETNMYGCLNLSGMNLTDKDIKVLSEFTNITDLILSNNKITDLSCLSGLTELKTLTYHNNSVRSLEFAKNLTNLTVIGAENNGITDLSPLSKHTKLEEIWLSWNSFTTIEPLSKCKNLRALSVSGSPIGNINALEGKKKLTTLHVDSCQLSSIEPLRGCTTLKQVNISYNRIKDITPMNSSILDQLWMASNDLNGNYDAISGIKITYEIDISYNGFDPDEFYNYTYNMVADTDGFYYSV